MYRIRPPRPRGGRRADQSLSIHHLPGAQYYGSIVLNGRLTITGNVMGKRRGPIGGSGTITFAGDGYLSGDRRQPLTPEEAVRIDVPIEAQTLTITDHVQLARPNNVPGGMFMNGIVDSAVQGALGSGPLTLRGAIVVRVPQTVGDLMIDSYFPQSPYGGGAGISVPYPNPQPPQTLTIDGDISGHGLLSVNGVVRHRGGGTVENARINVSGGYYYWGEWRQDGTLSGSAGGTLELAALNRGRITGSGVINGTVYVGDRYSGATAIAPGTIDGPGRLTVEHAVFGHPNLAADPYLQVDLNGLIAASQYDQLVVTSGLKIWDGTIAASIGYPAVQGDSFTVIDNQFAGPVDGIFTGLPEGAIFLAGLYPLQISYVGGDGNDVTLTVVPEPSEAGAGLALGVLALRRRACRR